MIKTGSTVQYCCYVVSDICIIHFQTVVSILFSYEITIFTEKTTKYSLYDDKIKGFWRNDRCPPFCKHAGSRLLPNAPNIPNCGLVLKLARYRVSRALEASLSLIQSQQFSYSASLMGDIVSTYFCFCCTRQLSSIFNGYDRK